MLNDFIAFNRIKDGDIIAFERIFRQYYAPLCLYAQCITGRREISEEVVQEVFYNIWKERESMQMVRSVKNYLYGAVRNRSLHYNEHKAVVERHHERAMSEPDRDTELSPQDLLEYKELESIIKSTLNKLPERRTRIFQMHRTEGKKYQEIAADLSISIKTVEAEMTKAYRALRQEIERYNAS